MTPPPRRHATCASPRSSPSSHVPSHHRRRQIPSSSASPRSSSCRPSTRVGVPTRHPYRPARLTSALLSHLRGSAGQRCSLRFPARPLHRTATVSAMRTHATRTTLFRTVGRARPTFYRPAQVRAAGGGGRARAAPIPLFAPPAGALALMRPSSPVAAHPSPPRSCARTPTCSPPSPTGQTARRRSRGANRARRRRRGSRRALRTSRGGYPLPGAATHSRTRPRSRSHRRRCTGRRIRRRSRTSTGAEVPFETDGPSSRGEARAP